jgi:DNA-binding NarL/FixJ family response regulator
MKPRVLLADDHTVVRFGLRALLEMSGMQVVGEADDGREALRLAEELQPDLAILDVTMPGLNGIDATAVLRERSAGTRVVILSMHSDSEHVHRAFAAGASAYLLKGSAGDEIVAAARAVMGGGFYASRELAYEHPGRAVKSSDRRPLERLSVREREVLQLVVEGHSSAQIAAMVHLSPKSVDTYRSRLMKKLGVPDVTALVKFAVQHGLTPASSTRNTS